MTPNQFTDTYKRLPDEKLIDIIDNKKDFNPLAIETAIFELKSRQLTEKQISDAKQLNSDNKNKKAQADKIVKEKIEAAKNTAHKALTILDPLVEKTPQKTIKLIGLVLGLLAIVKLVSNFSMIIALFKDTDWDFSVAIFLFDLLFLPIALIQFGRQKTSGRVLLSIWLIYNLLSGLSLFLLLFNFSHSDTPLSFLLPQTDETTFLITILFSAGLLFYINKKDVKPLFK
jgi:hypothetical protein